MLPQTVAMPNSIECIIGLGNPGPKYAATRHNAGYWFVDEIGRRHGALLRPERKFAGETGRLELAGHRCWLLKPTTFMNRSGQAVGALARFYRIPVERLLVVHDDLDLPPGNVRLKRGGGHGGHNGLRDIMAALGSRDFYRLRIGIGHPGHKEEVVDYVLSPPAREESILIRSAIDRAADQLRPILEGRLEQVMNNLHRKT